MNLFEGLRQNDLEGLVLPVISIDQFESKIDDDAIVVAFYVEYKDPAADLNRFIQKSAADLLDTELSPAPTEEGYYVVFVEFVRNSEFPESLLDILENLESLVGFSEWRFTAYGIDGIHNLDKETIEANVRLTANSQDEVDNASDDVPAPAAESIDRSIIDRILAEGRIKHKNSKRSTLSMPELKLIASKF